MSLFVLPRGQAGLSPWLEAANPDSACCRWDSHRLQNTNPIEFLLVWDNASQSALVALRE